MLYKKLSLNMVLVSIDKRRQRFWLPASDFLLLNYAV